MEPLINLKYLAKNNGYWTYERKVPKKVLGHPYWNGKKHWRKSFGLAVGSPEQEVISSWEAAHQEFQLILANIQERNIHILSDRERKKRALAHLSAYGLKPSDGHTAGIVDDDERRNTEPYVDAVLEGDAFEALSEWGKQVNYGDPNRPPPVGDAVPSDVTLQKDAWVLFTQPSEYKPPVLFGDCWGIYQSGKSLDPSKSNTKRARTRWNKLYELVGDAELTADNINSGLRAWAEAQKEREVSQGTVRREYTVLQAVLNYTKRAKALGVSWVKPDLMLQNYREEVPTEIMDKAEIVSLLADAADTAARRHQPWKEFILTILSQSSAIISELVRLERANIHLDAETPYLSLYSQNTKTKKSRKRIVPLVFRVERIRALLDEMDEGQKSALPPDIVKPDGDSWDWVKTPENANHQLNAYLESCDREGRGYRTYSLRHSFKHYLHAGGGQAMDILYLSGWYGKEDADANMLKHYGRRGVERPEILARFEATLRKALYFLADDAPSNVLHFGQSVK